MFEIAVEHEFCAAHALSIGGAREALHGHNFKITVGIRGKTTDGDGLLCDFHTVREILEELTEPLDNANLHDTDAFRGVNPSAENLAKHLGDELAQRLDGSLAPHASVSWVRVTEAPGCAATYWRTPG